MADYTMSRRLRLKVEKAEAMIQEIREMPVLSAGGQLPELCRCYGMRDNALRKIRGQRDMRWVWIMQRLGEIQGKGSQAEYSRCCVAAGEALEARYALCMGEYSDEQEMGAKRDFIFDVMLRLAWIFSDTALNEGQEKYLQRRWEVYKAGYGIAGGVVEDGYVVLHVYCEPDSANA